MAVLVVAQADGAKLVASSRNTISAAAKLSDEIVVLLAGKDVGDAAQQAAACAGVSRVLTVADESLGYGLPEPLADCVVQVQNDVHCTHILFAESAVGKAAMPRVAGLLRVPAVSGVTAVLGPDTFKRFIYAGGVLATVKVQGSPIVMTVRPTSFPEDPAEGGQAAVEQLSFTPVTKGSEFVSVQVKNTDKVDLLTAKRVAAGGRGLDKAGFELLDEFANKIGAAVGSTRAAVDMGLASNDTQVGQTGKIVAPELYFAFAISGALQHLAGMKDSKVIVAVNKDPEAPIFDISDYYLVADAEPVLKELIEKI